MSLDQVVPRLLERAAKASRLACATFGPLHSRPEGKSASSSGGGGGGLDMDVDESDAAGGGWGKSRRHLPGDPGGAASEEGVGVLQVTRITVL